MSQRHFSRAMLRPDRVGLWLVLSGLFVVTEARGQSNDSPRVLFAVSVTEAFLNQSLSSEISGDSNVAETILDTRVGGTATTTGRLSIELTPSATDATFTLMFQGHTAADTVGRNGPAIIHSSTYTDFTARKRVEYDSVRGFGVADSSVAAATSRQVRGVCSTLPGLRGRIVQRVARRRLAQSAAEIDAISRRLARQRIAASFDALAEARLERLNRAIYVLRPATDKYLSTNKLASRITTAEGQLRFWLEPIVELAGENDEPTVDRASLPPESAVVSSVPSLFFTDSDPAVLRIWLYAPDLQLTPTTIERSRDALRRIVAELMGEPVNGLNASELKDVEFDVRYEGDMLLLRWISTDVLPS